MEIKLKSGRIIKVKKDISLDVRDELLDNIKYKLDKDGNIAGFECMNSTITKWLRASLSAGSSDKDLIKWTVEERTDAFLKLQSHFSLGEEKASK